MWWSITPSINSSSLRSLSPHRRIIAMATYFGKTRLLLTPTIRVAPQLTVVSAPSFNQALERMRGTPSLRGWRPTRRWHVKRQQFPDRPAMIRDARGHRRGGPATGVGQTRMGCAKIIDRAHQEHPLVQRQGLAGQCPAPARQRCEVFTERRVEPFDVCRVDDPVALRPAAECLHACRRAIHNAALRVDDATTLVAFDHLGDQDVAPGPQPRPPAFPRAHGIAKGLANRSDVGAQPISTEQQRTVHGAAAHSLDQPPDQGHVTLLADLAAQPQAGLHHHGHGHPDNTALLLDAQLVGLHLSEVPWLLDEILVHGLALPPRARPPIRYRAFVEPKRRHNRLHRTPMGEQRHDEAHRLGRGAQAVEHRAFGGAERLMARVADEALLLA